MNYVYYKHETFIVSLCWVFYLELFNKFCSTSILAHGGDNIPNMRFYGSLNVNLA